MDGSHNLAAPDAQRHALIVSTYFKGATAGKGLGTAGYSYEFVRQLFLPLLKRWGEVIFVKDAIKEVEPLGQQVRARGLSPIHVGFVACQDLYLSPSMPNVVVPAWEFPDVPNVAFDGNPQNDWVATANRCDMVWAHVPFTAKALLHSGVTSPIREVPVPMPEEYFDVPMRRTPARATIKASGYVFSGVAAPKANPPAELPPTTKPTLRQTARKGTRQALKVTKTIAKALTPNFIWSGLQVFKQEWARSKAIRQIDHPLSSPVELSGYVYTSIFNPADGRKNWRDLITGFVTAMKDYDDATLVLKLVTNDLQAFYDVYDCYRKMVMPHRCRVVMIRDYLSQDEMMKLLDASSYYVTTTRAEGNCLPLMNYLAAGRPGISPAHSAIGDYFDADVGFVVESHTAPAYWPQELRPKYRTSWARLVWPSLVEQLRQSYHVAKHERRTYEQLSDSARTRIRNWLHEDSVYPLLRNAINAVASKNAAEQVEVVERRAA